MMTIHRANSRFRIDPLTALADAQVELQGLEPRTLLSTTFAYHELTDVVSGPEPIYVLRPAGENAPARTIGSSVSAVGDVDGDGVPDILVGSGGVNAHGQTGDRAVAAVYSGKTGDVLFTVSDGFSEFGTSVAGIGDVNGDGHPDFAVGSPRARVAPPPHGGGGHDDHDDDHHGGGGGDEHEDSADLQLSSEEESNPLLAHKGHWANHPGPAGEVGRVYVYSGADGSVLFTLTGPGGGSRFGEAVAGAGDFDHDGTPDIIVGAPAAADGAGQAFVYSGHDGSLLAAFSGADHEHLGFSVAGAGDLDGDGFDDVIVGAPSGLTGQERGPGRVVVFSGQDHDQLFQFSGGETREGFGFAVSSAGDVNGDGTPDIAVGAPFASNQAEHVPFAGRVVVFSGADGLQLITLRGDLPRGNFGASVAPAGDLNLDGTPDLLIGAPAATAEARVIVVSGIDGATLREFRAGDLDLVGSDRIGTSVAALGDVNGDGVTDFVFAGTQDANPARNDRSRMYVFSGTDTIALPPSGINNNADVWGHVGSQDFLILNGAAFLLPSRAGFQSGDRVIDVNDSDTVLGARDAAGHQPFLWHDGTRTELSALIQQTVGADGTFTDLRAVDITDNGLVLVEQTRDDGTPTTWLLDGNTLTFLLDGTPVRMNDQRMVLVLPPGTTDQSEVWTTDSGVFQIDGLVGADINASGTVVGTHTTDSGPTVETWSGGTTTDLGTIDGAGDITPVAINSKGQIVGRYTLSSTGAVSGFLYEDGAFSDIKPLVTVDAPPAFLNSTSLVLVAINDTGTIVGRLDDAHAGFLLHPIDDSGPFGGGDNVAVSTATGADGVQTVVTVNEGGEVKVFKQDSSTGQWTSVDLTSLLNGSTATDGVAFVDAGTARVSAGIQTADGLIILSQGDDGTWSAENITTELGGLPIASGLTTFTSTDGVVFIAGVAGNGDMVMYTQTPPTTPGNAAAWAFQDTTSTDLQPKGEQTPAFTGRLTSYVTAWNGLTVAGLDASGHIRAVWTAPGMGRWAAIDLSSITGASPIEGGLSVYLTPWGGINLAGVDEDGNTVVTWWVPSFGGQWAKTDLTSQFSGPKLRPESITSFVTSWGALNVAGRDDAGRVVAYWWVPSFGGQWQITPLAVNVSDARLRPMGRIESSVGADNSLNLYGTGRFGDLVRLHWKPGQDWQVDDVTRAAQR